MDSLPPANGEAKPMSFLAGALWTVVFVIVYSLVLGVIESAHPGAFFDLVTRTAGQLLAYSLVLFAILRIHEPTTSIRHVLAIRMPSLPIAFFAIVLGLSLAAPSLWLDEVFARRFPLSEAETEAMGRVFDVGTLAKKIGVVVTMGVLAPVSDELFFRGALFTPLKRGRRAESVILAVAAYETLAEYHPRAALALLVASMLLTWLRAVSGSVLPSALASVAFSAVQYVPMAIGRELPRVTRLALTGSVAALVVSVGAIALFARRDPKALEARRGDG